MTLAEIHDVDMAKILSESGMVFTYSGADYACTATEAIKQKPLAEGGFVPEFDLTLSTRVALFGTLPTAGQKVTFDGTEYRIQRVRKNFTGKILNLDLITPNK